MKLPTHLNNAEDGEEIKANLGDKRLELSQLGRI